jgi:translation initiation factor 1
MDLKDQLKNLFPDHTELKKEDSPVEEKNSLWIQEEPILCKYEKRKGKPITILEGYTGTSDDFKALAKSLKQQLGVGGSAKNETILIQGDYRDQIMEYLKNLGFRVKRVGG